MTMAFKKCFRTDKETCFLSQDPLSNLDGELPRIVKGWALNAGLLEGMGASQVLALNNLGGGGLTMLNGCTTRLEAVSTSGTYSFREGHKRFQTHFPLSSSPSS